MTYLTTGYILVRYPNKFRQKLDSLLSKQNFVALSVLYDNGSFSVLGETNHAIPLSDIMSIAVLIQKSLAKESCAELKIMTPPTQARYYHISANAIDYVDLDEAAENKFYS